MNRQEQRRRLEARRADPLRTCKLRRSTIHRWDDRDPYIATAGGCSRRRTHRVARWIVVNANDKRSAPINATMHVLHALSCDGQDPEAAAPDPAMVAPLDQVERSRPRVHAAEPR